jgi:hypothetical protein
MTASPAFTFVLIMGMVNFFGDVTYEGGASINGQYLGALGASAAAIGIVAGVGEFLGYSLRSVAGYVADRTGRYWLCMLAGACFAAGLMSFELVSYHLANTKLVAEPWIPVMLGFSTGCAVIASLVLGKLYDRVGMPVVCAAVVLSSLFAPFAFHGSLTAALVAMPLWGIGYAAQDTLLKVLIAGGLPEDGVRTLLHRVRRRMADRQHFDRVDV